MTFPELFFPSGHLDGHDRFLAELFARGKARATEKEEELERKALRSLVSMKNGANFKGHCCLLLPSFFFPFQPLKDFYAGKGKKRELAQAAEIGIQVLSAKSFFLCLALNSPCFWQCFKPVCVSGFIQYEYELFKASTFNVKR